MAVCNDRDAEVAALRSAARQHLKAANALGAFDGVVLPQLHNAALSIELQLTLLALREGGSPAQSGDELAQGLRQLPPALNASLCQAFAERHGASLEGQLQKFSKAFHLIRHRSQIPDFYEGFDLGEFMQLARFFGEAESLA
jgi:hypothetical protein